MRQFVPKTQKTFKFTNILQTTAKAYLFEISEGISIWVPKRRVFKKNLKSFTVRGNHILDVKLAIYAEQQSLNK
jgi:hypothetical protein